MELTILIIRHAEKPDESWPGPGLTPDGSADKKSLVIRGWQRAGSWSALLGAGLAGDDFPRPAVIYAADPKTTTGDASQRPFETITPLAARLGLTPVVTYALGQEPQLVAEIVGLTGVVLVCWEHKAIASTILPAIASGQPLPEMPEKWDGARFDVLLRFDRSIPGTPWSFRQLFPRLLSGDSETPCHDNAIRKA
ncbi:MAG: histidine phosphatase family protein [Methylocella sp.]